MIIRIAEEKDIDKIVELIILFEKAIEEIYQGDFSGINIDKNNVKKVLIEGFNDKYHVFLVIEEKQELIGFGDMWIYPEFGHAGYSAYLQNFFVKKEYQNKGYGTKLLNKLMEIAKSKKATAFHITTSFKNKKAIALYKKMGFSEGLLLDKVFKYE
ncbi:MAG: GNAT family N-acetyltransferase [Promethearchaeota archaeon]